MSDETLYTSGPAADHVGEVPVLVHALQGGMDAGSAGELAVRQLLSSMPVERVATFDTEQLLDLRSRRPAMTFADGRWVDYDEPVLAVDAVRDHEGRALLVLHGHEPDHAWESFARAVAGIVREHGVELVVGLQGVPAGVPHTRPAAITTHGTDRDAGGRLEPGPNLFVGEFQAPGSAEALLDLRLSQQGMNVLGLAVHVPHYLSGSEYPVASASLLRTLSTASGMSLPVGDLESLTAQVLAQIDSQVEANPEIAQVVRALEERYDRSPVARTTTEEPAAELPTADEIGAELEAFLASGPPLEGWRDQGVPEIGSGEARATGRADDGAGDGPAGEDPAAGDPASDGRVSDGPAGDEPSDDDPAEEA
ncbi:proteasome assembly chaperone family protein [Georgenia sp. Z1491]|uniref:proteasome assembly chaperone family protein n=1 Tax=Georgenia sp. Z1491 TaxID=3416707 RepID=UPI003CF1B00B